MAGAYRQFRTEDPGRLLSMMPPKLQYLASVPTPINESVFGRVELCIGRLGAGKTTWAAQRARRLARATGRELVTNGVGWDEPWRGVASFGALLEVRDAVLLLDELHLLAPSSKGLLGVEDERRLLTFLSLLRKRRTCVVGTTQAWTRVATHVRQLVTLVWVCRPVNPGRLHLAYPCDVPEDGGEQVWSRHWFVPAKAAIPTNAEAWSPWQEGAA